MKHITRILCLTLIAVMLCTSLVACAKVKGSYVSEAGVGNLAGGKVTYNFKSASKVELTVEGTVLGHTESKTYKGKYEINEKDDGKMEIKFTFEGEDAKSYNTTETFSIDKENDAIKIGLVTYKKVKK